MIFEQLDYKTTTQIQSVNTAFHNAIQKYEEFTITNILHRNYYYFNYNFNQNKDIKTHLEKIRQKENIKFSPVNKEKKTPDDSFFDFCKTMKNAKSIKIYPNITEWDALLLSKLEKTNIDTIIFCFMDQENFLKIDFSTISSLTSIVINNFNFPEIESKKEEYFFLLLKK